MFDDQIMAGLGFSRGSKYRFVVEGPSVLLRYLRIVHRLQRWASREKLWTDAATPEVF